MVHPHHPRGIHSHRAALLAAGLSGAAAGYLAGTAHIRRLRRQLAAAHHDALHDPLTGLPNRRAAVSVLQQRLRAGRPTLVAIIDLDGFKAVNDTYGHTTGDDLLTVVAARLRQATAPSAFAARLAGDEFLILLPDEGSYPVERLRHLAQRLAAPVRLPAVRLRPRASIGVATTRTDTATSWRRLLNHADRALYRAKRTGAGVAVYDPASDGEGHDSRLGPRTRRDHPPCEPRDPTD
jgi:diguanylate cyclase (GGDEF)-like protein